jgi:hypothetical protein
VAGSYKLLADVSVLAEPGVELLSFVLFVLINGVLGAPDERSI